MAAVEHVIRYKSDHIPILVRLKGRDKKRIRKKTSSVSRKRGCQMKNVKGKCGLRGIGQLVLGGTMA